MRSWKELTASALEGTAKSGGGEGLDTKLLNEAAWHTLTRLAGRKAEIVSVPAAEEAPAEDLALVSRAAAQRLEEILRTDDRAHLGEWMDLAAQARKRVPPSLLPPLLERGAEKAQLRANVLATGGKRVGWLAGQNEEWAYAAISDPEEAFKTGVRAARVAALAALRHDNAAAALAMLAGTWQQEGGDDRVALIQVLHVGLSPADVSFLTDATKDGRKDVRATAADLLARLPTSPLIARMVARADSWIVFKKGMLGAKLEVEPPTECTPDMIADGIEPKPPKGIGERAHWLRQVLALVPPSHWPIEIFGAGAKSQWQQPLVEGWTDAATRFADAPWCELLIEHYLGVKERYKVQGELRSLVRAMPAAARETLLERLLRKGPPLALEVAVMTGDRFSAPLSAKLFDGLEQEYRRWQKQQDYVLAGIAGTLKGQLDPSVVRQVVAAVDRANAGDAAPATEAFQAMAATLEYRAEMAKEIAS